jgi:hypothetical protein
MNYIDSGKRKEKNALSQIIFLLRQASKSLVLAASSRFNKRLA